MSKPVLDVTLTSTDRKRRKVPALFDSGSFYTIVRSDRLPSSQAMLRFKVVEKLGTARRRAKVRIIGATDLIIAIGDRMIRARALVSPDLSREMIIGAETMQGWDISVKNRNGRTKVIVGRDMRDPEITEVD